MGHPRKAIASAAASSRQAGTPSLGVSSRRPASKNVIVLSSSYRETCVSSIGCERESSLLSLPRRPPVKPAIAREDAERPVDPEPPVRPAAPIPAERAPPNDPADLPAAEPPVRPAAPEAVAPRAEPVVRAAVELVERAASPPRAAPPARFAVPPEPSLTDPALPTDVADEVARTAVVAPRVIPDPRAELVGLAARAAVVAPLRIPERPVEVDPADVGRAIPVAPPRAGTALPTDVAGEAARTAVVAPRVIPDPEGDVARTAAPDRMELAFEVGAAFAASAARAAW